MMFKKMMIGLLSMAMFSCTAKEFKAGQVWAYKTRVHEEQSSLYIVKVEQLPNGEQVFHVYLDKLKIKNSALPNGIQTDMPHAPVSKETLNKSVTNLLLNVDAVKLPDISEGYAVWKEAFDAGDAGVFTISIAEILEVIEQAVNRQAKP